MPAASSTIVANDTEVTFPVSQANRIRVNDNGDVSINRNAGRITFEFSGDGDASPTVRGQGNLSSSSFTFEGGGSLTLTNNQISNSDINGSIESESIGLQSRKTVNTSIALGDGADFVTMGNAGNSARNVNIDFGENDGDIDRLSIQNLDQLRKVTVDNFGNEDVITVEGTTYDRSGLTDEVLRSFQPQLRINFTDTPS